MKILVFAPYYPPHIGGLEIYADELNKNLSKKVSKIIVFAPQLPIDASSFETWNNIEIIRFPAFEIIPNYPLPKFWSPTFWKSFFSIYKIKHDIVISHTRFFIISTLPALVFSEFKKIPWIHIEHGADFVQANNKLIAYISKCYDKTLGKMALNKSNQIIAASENAKLFVNSISQNKNISVITRGFNYDYFNEIKPDNSVISKNEEGLNIIFIGRLIDGKGIPDLIDAINILSDKPIKCYIVGDGPQKQFILRKISELNLDKSIRVLGYKPHEDIVSLIKSADVLINTSYSEGFSNVLIEAALCKKAIITTNVGIAPEIIIHNKTGIITEMRNPETLAEKINFLLNNKNRIDEFGEAVYYKTIPLFNWDKKIQEFLNIFQKLIR